MSSTRRHPPTRKDAAQGKPRHLAGQATAHAAPSAVDTAIQDDPQVLERISMLPDDRYLLTPAEAARRLSISRALCYRLISSGEIPSIQIGSQLRRIPVHALEAYIEAKLADSTGKPGR